MWFERYDFDMPNIEFNFNSSGVDPANMHFLCVRFGKGDYPNQTDPRVPFTVMGVCNAFEETEYTDALTVCQDIRTTGKMSSGFLFIVNSLLNLVK